ncbi:hypothetical protein J8J42_03680 [Chryseobacterium sp. cx-311]|uniref:hypothetical protein n=1 Tax=Marnyiella aurantia TaxID=2758037 RepID=UPI001AEA5D4F|nr:hypothetical protein [Marnyiella aurantia]MBP0612146.1 hypothetical protein [Marnyiella aurantia]
MNRKYVPLLIALILLIGFSATFFIYKSNDHMECGTDVRYSISADGNPEQVRSHVCKERFSF